MSYILEALRKSERQRQIANEHGGGMLYPAMVEHPRSASVSLWLGGTGLTAVFLALLVWLWPRSQGAAQMAAQVGAQVAAHVAAQGSAQLPGQATGLVESSVAQPSATGIVGYPRPAQPIPVVQAPRRPAATVAAAVTTPVTKPTPAVAAKPVASASPGNQAVAVLTMANDPTMSMVESGKNAANGETWQAELPTIAIAGYIRDEQGISLAMINEKLVREGEEVAPNLRLEKILNDGSIFNFKGYLFRR